MRFRARVDSNQPEIVQAFRKRGATVICLHQLGRGIPDILVGYRGVNVLVEIKDGSKPPSQRKLTVDERLFFNEWKGQTAIVESVNDVVTLMAEISIYRCESLGMKLETLLDSTL